MVYSLIIFVTSIGLIRPVFAELTNQDALELAKINYQFLLYHANGGAHSLAEKQKRTEDGHMAIRWPKTMLKEHYNPDGTPKDLAAFKKIPAEIPIKQVAEIFKKYKVISLKELKRDHLVVGCGNNPDNHCSSAGGQKKDLYHPDQDTINGDIFQYPDVAAFIVEPEFQTFIDKTRNKGYKSIYDDRAYVYTLAQIFLANQPKVDQQTLSQNQPCLSNDHAHFLTKIREDLTNIKNVLPLECKVAMPLNHVPITNFKIYPNNTDKKACGFVQKTKLGL